MKPTPAQLRSDLRYARIAKRCGMQNSLRTAWEARAAGVSPSLAFAMVEQESGDGANVFGHDDSIYRGAGKITKAKYFAYKRQRGPFGHGGMQGVGPLQLTWYSIQDAADSLGGCHLPKHNLRQGFRTLAELIRVYGHADGIRRYNGSGPAADAYSHSVQKREQKWHKRFHG